MFDILKQHQFLIKRSKCSFATQSVEYLGHVILVQGVSTDPSKVQAIQQWPSPTNIKQLRGFFSLTGYYRKFIRNYGMITKPHTNLLRKNNRFLWTPNVEEAFQLLKRCLVAAPMLVVPDFSQQFVVKTDASDNGIRAMLMQHNHLVAYLSKPLGPRNKALSVYEKECLAILLAIEKWRAYLQHQHFIIKTDHRSLQYLTDQRVSSKLQLKALIKLMDLRYTIQYKKGTSNAAADSLSRYDWSQELNAISECVPTWIQKLKEGFEDDSAAKGLLT